MNLYEDGTEVESSNKKNRRRVMISIIICTVLAVVLIALIVLLIYLDSKKIKLYIDEKRANISSTIFQYDSNGDVTLVSIKELAELTGYETFNGKYGEYTENKDSCYIQNDYEAVSFALDSNVVKKYLFENAFIEPSEKNNNNTATTDTTTYKSLEIYETGDIVQNINGILYIPIDKVSTCFSLYFYVNGKKINFYTPSNLVNRYEKTVISKGYDGISKRYVNARAVADGKLIVYGSNQYAAIDINTMEEIVGRKYNDLQYIQSSKEFIVKANDNMGLLSDKGETKIAPTEKYTSLEIYDNVNQLYLVGQNNKYGVIKANGQEIVPVEFDKIGIDNNFDEENTRVLSGSLIPVSKITTVANTQTSTNSSSNNASTSKTTETNKWGFYDINGNQVKKLDYDGIGYNKTTADPYEIKSTINIPKEILGYEGIIVYQEKTGYGIIDTKGNDKVPTLLEKVYMEKNLGVTTYYAVYNGKKSILSELLKDYQM